MNEVVSSLSTEGGAGEILATVLYGFLDSFFDFTYLFKPHKQEVGLLSICSLGTPACTSARNISF